jgi:cytochrome P450
MASGKFDTQENTTIFHDLLESDLPQSEKTSERLAQEAVLLTGAGTHTTSWAMSVAAFHLLSQPMTLRKLKSELELSIPDLNGSVSLSTLEKLPYLTAVLKEGLRLSFGSTNRIPRIPIDKPMDFHGWEIPVGTPVSMSIPLQHLDEHVFPHPNAFHPERWIEDTTGHLDKYLVTFCKGPRGCLGLNLAWAELYIGISTIFRRFGSPAVRGNSDLGIMQLYETDLGDVEMVRDGLFPMPKDGSKGIRVKISR